MRSKADEMASLIYRTDGQTEGRQTDALCLPSNAASVSKLLCAKPG